MGALNDLDARLRDECKDEVPHVRPSNVRHPSAVYKRTTSMLGGRVKRGLGEKKRLQVAAC